MTWRPIRLVVLSPLHIGAKQLLTELDYLRDGRTVHVLSPGEWVRWLDERHLLEQYASAEMRGEPPHQFLDRVLAGAKPPWERIARYQLRTFGELPKGELHPFIRDPWDRPYVPGSTLKGALRTAVLGAWCLQHPSELEETVNQALARPNFHIRPFGLRLEQELYGRIISARNAETLGKPFQELRLRDSDPIPKESVALYPVEVWSWRRDGSRYQRARIWVECLVPGTEITTAYALDPASALTETGLEEAVRRWGQHHWSHEKNWWAAKPTADGGEIPREFYRATPPDYPLRLGWGSGWAALSLGSALSPEIRQQLSRHWRAIGSLQFPRSRRVAVDDEHSAWPMGWLQWRQG